MFTITLSLIPTNQAQADIAFHRYGYQFSLQLGTFTTKATCKTFFSCQLWAHTSILSQEVGHFQLQVGPNAIAGLILPANCGHTASILPRKWVPHVFLQVSPNAIVLKGVQCSCQLWAYHFYPILGNRSFQPHNAILGLVLPANCGHTTPILLRKQIFSLFSKNWF